ncbi:MAG: hypothetical protein PHP37_02090 [Patescibacteria group bacterium]|nr:hypothetical protein [Patescibacteria group bacterium]
MTKNIKYAKSVNIIFLFSINKKSPVSKVAGKQNMENKSFQGSASFKQGMELMRIVELAFNKANPSADQVDALVQNPDPIYAWAGEIFAKKFDNNKNSRQIKATWQRIYKKWFGLQKDFSDLQVPEHYDPRKHFAVIAAQGLTMNQVVAGMRKRFKVSLYKEDLDATVEHNDRDAKNGDYIVLFNKNIEADEEFKNLSANQLKTVNHKGITLLERLLLEVLYFDRTKKHLDISNGTLCSGSYGSGGNVPRVDWSSSDDELSVSWRGSGSSGDSLRSRAVVS